jgi:energy-coupling factor transporter ATP-binding protein EcfA2
MNAIKLKKLTLKNFKGIKDLSLDFDKTTNIYGDNGTGKTTIFDAFTWLLFDKDSQDRIVGDKESNFQIKTYDSTGTILHGLEHSVTGCINVNGKDLVFSKTYKEKWTKKKGEADRQLTGHETLYYINEVPSKQSEYKAKINGIIDESLFKLISNPTYFSMNLKWQDRRKTILDIIGDIDCNDVIDYNSELKPLISALNDTDIDTLKKSIAARKRKLNDDIKSLPFRIDECNNSIVDINFDLLQNRKPIIVSSIKSLEEQLIDKSKINDEYLNEKDKVYELKDKLRSIEYEAKSAAQLPIKKLYEELSICEREISKNESMVSRLTNNIQIMNTDIVSIDKQLQELRDKWGVINKKTLIIPEDEFICPTCRRPFEAADIEAKKQEFQENFNQSKAKKLADINSIGKAKKSKMEDIKMELDKSNQDLEIYNSKLAELYNKKADLQGKINNFTPEVNLEANEEYQRIESQVTELEAKLAEPIDSNSLVEDIRARKSNLERELEKINHDLGLKEQNEKLKARIAELTGQEKKLAQQIAELEGQDFLCDKFIKTKVELLESSINSKFKYVSFKLFNTLVNGAVEECCEALINGVPFSNANKASQINAGLDIINALCNHYKVEAPIFIDNRESINEILNCDSQIINLVVSQDKKIKNIKY